MDHQADAGLGPMTIQDIKKLDYHQNIKNDQLCAVSKECEIVISYYNKIYTNGCGETDPGMIWARSAHETQVGLVGT